MKKIISIILVISLLCSNAYAVVIYNEDQQREDSTQWVTKAEFYKWAQEMQDWFDVNSELELYMKIASASEAHGYKSEHGLPRDQIEPYIIRR